MTDKFSDEPLNRELAFGLIKMYEDKGWAVKQQMFASVSWLTPVIFALISFSFAEESYAIVASLTAFVLSVFLLILVFLSLDHANDDYTRAHKVIVYVGQNGLFPADVFDIMHKKEEKKKNKRLYFIGKQFKTMLFLVFVVALVSLLIAIWKSS